MDLFIDHPSLLREIRAASERYSAEAADFRRAATTVNDASRQRLGRSRASLELKPPVSVSTLPLALAAPRDVRGGWRCRRQR